MGVQHDSDWNEDKQFNVAQSAKTKFWFLLSIVLNLAVSTFVGLNYHWVLGVICFMTIFIIAYAIFRKALLDIMMLRGPWPPDQ
jgi:hypothetical protein